jgi:phage terminase large subunit
VGIDDCQRYPGLKFLYLRSIKKAAVESFDDLVRIVLNHVPHEYSAYAGKLEFANGSRILLGGYKNEDDIDKYLGIAYDGIVVEELTLLSERKITLVLGSLRTTKEGWRPRWYSSTNPGGIGHSFFKRTFVIPWRDKTETATRYIPATHKDNKFLNKEYHEYLEGLTGPLGKAWRDGDFDSFEGMAFPDWDYDKHTIEPIYLPKKWVKWRAVDWGSASPFCCLWFTKDPDTGRIYVYRELYSAGLTDEEQAKSIKDLTPPDEPIHITYADPSLWEDQSHLGADSTAVIYKKNGVILTRANNDRLGGKRKIERLLAKLPDGQPGFQVFRSCRHLIDEMENLPSDPIRVEDVDTDAPDHAYDTARYGLTNYTLVKPPEKSEPQQIGLAAALTGR